MSGPFALATGAGKDATLALHRARALGWEVPVAFNVWEGSSGRVRFHGIPRELVGEHASALDLRLLDDHTHPDDFETVFGRMLERLVREGVVGVVYGNVHLEGIRSWYEERTTAAGLEHREPLWGDPPGELVREFVDLGYGATVVSVDLERGDPGWLGRELDRELVEELEARGCDPCGEHGEYHTFVHDGPLFRRSVQVESAGTVEMEGHRLLDLTPV